MKDVNIWLPQAVWHSATAGSSGSVPRTRRLPTYSAFQGWCMEGGKWGRGERLPPPPTPGISIRGGKPAFGLGRTNASPLRRLKESPFPFAPLCTLPLREACLSPAGLGAVSGDGQRHFEAGAWAESLCSHQRGWLGSDCKWCLLCAS